MLLNLSIWKVFSRIALEIYVPFSTEYVPSREILPFGFMTNFNLSESPLTTISPISSPTKTLTVEPLSTLKRRLISIFTPFFVPSSILTTPVLSSFKNLSILNSSTEDVVLLLRVKILLFKIWKGSESVGVSLPALILSFPLSKPTYKSPFP